MTTAHRIALDWARNAKTGNQTLIYYKDHWYKVERFDDALNNYQVEEFITKAEFEDIYKEIKEYGGSGKIESIQGRVDWIDSCNRQSYSLKKRGPSLDGLESRYRAEDNQIQRVGKKQVERGERTASDERRNSANSSTNRQIDEISFSLKDSKGNTLTKEQAKFFADSKVRDDNGNLLVVYHGTEGTFFTFDKALRGSVTGTRDAKLGFFFTRDKEVALEYAIEALDTKIFNLRNKIANGDREVLSLLAHVDGYKELAATEDVKEYGRLQDKSERYENDIMELYLNITNPLIEDWKGQPYKKTRMLKLVTRALQGDYDGVIVKNIDDAIDQTGENISDVFVAFEPNQIKSTLNKNPTLHNNDIRYSLKADINDYTEKQYNDFGWARVNGVLSSGGNQYFHNLFNQETRKANAFKTANKEYVIPTYDDMGKKHQANNILVFAKGKANSPIISKIYKIMFINENYLNETNLSILEEYIYEQERVGKTEEYLDIIKIVYPEANIIKYAKSDSPSYQEVKAERGRQDSRSEGGRVDEDYQREQDGSGNLGKNQGNVSYSLKADINDYTEKQYNDFGWARVPFVTAQKCGEFARGWALYFVRP